MNITEDDVGLLAQIAGGFNFNRAGKPYSERFDASVSWAKADALGALVSRLLAPPVELPSPPTPTPATPTVPVLGQITDNARHEFAGFGTWEVVVGQRSRVSVYEYAGPTAMRLLSSGLETTGGMSASLVLEPGTHQVSTWIYQPDPNVTYGSAIEVQPA